MRITPGLVKQHERMLTGGFYAEVTVTYDPHRPGANAGPFRGRVIYGRSSSPGATCWTSYGRGRETFNG